MTKYKEDYRFVLAALLVIMIFFFVFEQGSLTGLVPAGLEVELNESVEDSSGFVYESLLEVGNPSNTVYKEVKQKHSTKIRKGSYEITIIPQGQNAVQRMRLEKTLLKDTSQLVDFDEIIQSGTEYSRMFAIDPKEEDEINFDFIASGTELYRCRQWDFQNRICGGEWSKLMDIVPGQEYTVNVNSCFKEKGGCSCQGIRHAALSSAYTFTNGTNITAEAYMGSGTNPSQLLDTESALFFPQSGIDDNPGHPARGNLVIENINQSSITISFRNGTMGRILGDNTFQIKVNGAVVLGPQAIHLSCSVNIDIGDVYGPFTVVDIDKIMSGSECSKPVVDLIAPANSSTLNHSTVNLTYSVYDPDQSIDYCRLIINNSVYQTDYSITESFPQFFVQNLSPGSYSWSVNCTNSNGYEGASPTWHFQIINATVINDTAAPLVNLISPANNSIDSDGNITFSYNVTDDSPISFCQLFVNGTLLQTDASVTLNISQNFTQSLLPGYYPWYVNCTDIYNNTGMSQIWWINISLPLPGSPQVNLISPTDGYSTYQTDLFLVFNFTDDSPLSNCSLYLDGSLNQTLINVANNTNTAFNVSELGIGTHYWNVSCNDGSNTGWSSTWFFHILPNVTANVTACCCGLQVSTTPEVAGQGDKVLVAADVSNLFTGLAAVPADLLSINASIYHIENGSSTLIVNNAPMTYLADGLWYYEFYTSNHSIGTYIASVTMVTNQTLPFIKEASDTFTIGERVSGLTITGISPDLINLNETTRLAAELKFNGIGIDSSLISNASLVITKINGSSQTYNHSMLQVINGMIYLDGAFNETGVYYLDWSAAYLSQGRTAREIVVVVGWQDILIGINDTVNIELLNLIKESRQYLLQLLVDMEYLQKFSAEEIFLITDSVNSMTEVATYLQGGYISNEEAERQFNAIQSELMTRMGSKITGAVSAKSEQQPSGLRERLNDWKVVLFLMLLIIFGAVTAVAVMLMRVIRVEELYREPAAGMKDNLSSISPEKKQPEREEKTEILPMTCPIEFEEELESKDAEKRRYELILDRIRKKFSEMSRGKEKDL